MYNSMRSLFSMATALIAAKATRHILNIQNRLQLAKSKVSACWDCLYCNSCPSTKRERDISAKWVKRKYVLFAVLTISGPKWYGILLVSSAGGYVRIVQCCNQKAKKLSQISLGSLAVMACVSQTAGFFRTDYICGRDFLDAYLENDINVYVKIPCRSRLSVPEW